MHILRLTSLDRASSAAEDPQVQTVRLRIADSANSAAEDSADSAAEDCT